METYTYHLLKDMKIGREMMPMAETTQWFYIVDRDSIVIVVICSLLVLKITGFVERGPVFSAVYTCVTRNTVINGFN